MANWWVYSFDNPAFGVSSDPNSPVYALHFKLAYIGADVPGNVIQDARIEVEPLFADTPATILTKVVDQVVADAANRGLSVTRTGGLVVDFVRGQ